MNFEASTTPSSISVRQLNVDFAAGFPRWWHSGEPWLSHYWNSFSMLFPLGERHTVDIARDCLVELDKSGPPALQADARAFIGQEANHRRVHIEYNKVLEAQGYRNSVEPLLAWQLRQARGRSLRTQLAMGAAFEHWTATMADFYLGTPARSEGMAELPRQVWEWHGAEESEHKSVLFDLYRWCGGGYWRRIAAFVFMTLILFINVSYQRTAMLRHDRALLLPHTWRVALRDWFGRHGVAWHHLPRMLDYLRPGFHPAQRDSQALIEDWKQRSAGQYRIVHGRADAPPA
jgi:predicted metal-dependent hydrolase